MSSWETIDNGLVDPRWYANGEPRDAFARLRREDPIHWAESDYLGRGFWVISRYSDVREVLDDPLHFSSYRETRVPRIPHRLTTEQRQALGMDSSILTMDPPLHTLFRQPINKHFSVPSVARMQERVNEVCEYLIARAAGMDSCEVVEDLAGELPMRVILGLLDIPEDDWPRLRRLTWQFFAPADPRFAPPGSDPVEVSRAAHLEVREYSRALVERRRAKPQDDLATAVAQMTVDGAPLDQAEAASWVWLIILGGLETTRNALSVGLGLFLDNPEQASRLRENPALVPSAVEEVLRWSTPARARLRVVRQNYEFRGRKLKAGDWVIPFVSSANWDETVFPEPERFDVERSPNNQLSFGMGPHLCLGRALARLELSAFFPRFLDAFPSAQVLEEPEWIVDHMLNGYSTFRIRPVPADGDAA